MLERDLEKLRSNCSTTNKEKVHQQKNYSMLERDLEKLRTSCNTMKVQQQENYSMLERDLEKLRTSCNTMKVQQQENYSMLERELEELRTSCNTMNKEKVHQQKNYSMLERALEELRSSCSTMNEEKVQQQRKYNAVFKKLPFLEQYCPSSSQKSAACSSCTGRVCEPCPQGWEQFSSKCYYFSNEKKNWFDSRSDCIKRGADLVIIESEDEQRFITNIAKSHTWIGLSRSEFKSNWLWVDETPLQKG
ncbi:CD209 antigen-like [Anguilla rostrata]|uniref:CD209 antigen-like n=1 Tax=Anguilla rostrata TaxID=7938 RepID=UPI0030D4868F